MTIPSITPEPIGPPADPPTRDDPDNFRTRADDFVDWQANDFPTEIDGFITEMNTTISAMNATAVDVDADAAIALSVKEYVYAVYNAALWLSGTTYDQGDGAIGSNGYTYISLQGSNINHDPTTDDGTWWKRTNGPWPYNAESQSSSSDITLVATDPRMQRITMTAALKTVALPDAQNLEVGPMFWFWNEGSYAYIIQDYGGNALWIVEPDSGLITAYLVSTSTQNGTWKFGPGLTERTIYETPVVFDTNSAMYSATVNMDDSTMIVAYMGASDYGYVVAIDISDGSVLDGPIAINSVTSRYFRGDKVSSTEAVFAYFNDSDDDLEAVIVEYSGGTLSVTGGPIDVTTNIVQQDFGMCALSTSKIGVAFSDATNNDLRAVILDWNGSTLSITGSETQISSSAHAFMRCSSIDSSNFLVCAELASSNDVYAYSINWSGSVISENNNVQLGTHTVYIPGYMSITKLEDDGTYIWYACVFANSDYNNTATIEVVRVTKSTANAASSITVNNATSDVYISNGAAVLNEETLLIPYNVDPYGGPNRKSFISMFEWDSTIPALTAYPKEYQIGDSSMGVNGCIVTTSDDILCAGNYLNQGCTYKAKVIP